MESVPAWRRNFRLWTFCLYAFSTLAAQALMSIGVALLFVGIAVGEGGIRPLYRKVRDLALSPAIRPFFAASLGFIAVIALSLLTARLWPLSYHGETVRTRLLDLAKSWYFLAPFVTAAGLLALSAGERRTVIKVWLVAFGVLSVVGIAQFFTGWPRAQRIPTLATHYHATIFLGHHLSIASIWIFPLFASLDFIRMRDPRAACGLGKGALAAVAALGVTALILSFSRAVWGAIPVALVVWAAVRLGRRAIAPVAAVLLLALAASQLPVVKERFARGGNVSDRVELWKANVDFFLERPVLGAGFRKNHQMSGPYLKQKYPGRSWYFAGHAHNNLLDMLGGMGLAGALVFLMWSGLAAWMPYRAWREGAGAFGFPAGLVAAWAAFQVNGLTQLNFFEGKVSHQMMWAAAWAIAFRVLASGKNERTPA